MTDPLARNKIFNPDGDDAVENRTIIKGNTTGLYNLNGAKYTWAKKLYQVFIGNFWVPEKVKGLQEDALMFQKVLTPEEQRAYKGTLSFLTFLDSIQTVNLPNIGDFITAPEVKLLLAIQTFQEAIHSQSYATILESVVDARERQEIYYLFRNDATLLERNRYIGNIYQDFIDSPSDENLFKTIVADYLLEGLYFYNGFAFFDTLVDHGKMPATGRMIAYIRRDELSHVVLFGNILMEIKKEFPHMWNEEVIKTLTHAAVDQEIAWSTHILGDKIPGINGETTRSYTRWLANERLKGIGLAPLFIEATENPYKHLEHHQNFENDKSNFFETTVINYTQSSTMKGGWEF